ncbi:toxin MazF [Lactobacillus sp. PV034]|uniref:toxin MazF n=1 Tax=Lactobacillus sp. PV034 TaxID=2594495 RepID=UPI0022400C0C|nr:toxin MazF [Lactobacillus sp. PV034]QNQ80214.1 toxin MazF [Lactobacillus sp. PV034]
MNNKIATAYVRFIQLPGGKRRPIYILREDETKIYFWDITTKFQNKSKKIKKHYFEIKEYALTGLKRHSWIDTYQIYSITKSSTRIQYIGELSDNDTNRLVKFLSNKDAE